MAALSGASAPGPGPHFEVASVKPDDPKLPGASLRVLPGGHLIVHGMTIRNLIWMAWQLPPERVTGGPRWLDAEKFAIDAKPAPGEHVASAGPQQMDDVYPRIQNLLAERFGLKLHRETKVLNGLFLSVAKFGLRLQRATATTTNTEEKGEVLAWPAFVTILSSRATDFPVIDKTNLSGAWLIRLQYLSDDGEQRAIGCRPSPDDSAPSLRTAIREQMGLELLNGKAPLDVLVIDHIDRPTQN